uniref:Uncharacterized protein n=1 Tax=Aegilops tauschii subsp. strangulata TaxID=200361 RepID=A0A453D228_AEGTS
MYDCWTCQSCHWHVQNYELSDYKYALINEMKGCSVTSCCADIGLELFSVVSSWPYNKKASVGGRDQLLPVSRCT